MREGEGKRERERERVFAEGAHLSAEVRTCAPSAARNPRAGALGTLTAVEPPGRFVASHAQHWRELAWQRFVGRIATSFS